MSVTQISESGIQRAMRIIVTEVKKHLPHVTVVQTNALVEPTRDKLPLIRVFWDPRLVQLVYRPDFPSYVQEVPADFSQLPKVEGTQEGSGTVLEDSQADFSHVVPGDLVSAGDQVATVVEVVDEHTLLLDSEIPTGTEYRIYWPTDVVKHMPLIRSATVSFDIYAAADEPYGEGRTVDEIEHVLMGLLFTEIRRALQAELIEITDVEGITDVTGALAGTALAEDWYNRAVMDVRIFFSDAYLWRMGAVESVPIQYDPDLTEEDRDAGRSGFTWHLVEGGD